MRSLLSKIECVDRYYYDFIFRFYDDRSNLFNGIPPPLPFCAILKIKSIDKPAAFCGLAHPPLDRLSHFFLASTPLSALLNRVSRQPNDFHTRFILHGKPEE
jgi:hypothetical protein